VFPSRLLRSLGFAFWGHIKCSKATVYRNLLQGRGFGFYLKSVAHLTRDVWKKTVAELTKLFIVHACKSLYPGTLMKGTPRILSQLTRSLLGLCLRSSWAIIFNPPPPSYAVWKQKKIFKDIFSSVSSQFKKYHPSGNLKFNNSGISQSLKSRTSVGKIPQISLKLNFT